MQDDGSYEKPDRRGKASIVAHDVFKEEAAQSEGNEDKLKDERVFIPKERVEVF